MDKRKGLIYVISGLAILITIATIITYFVLEAEKPWMAFFIACCGGVLVLNLIFTLFLVFKNIKK